MLPISLLKNFGQPNVSLFIPPTVGNYSLVDYPILITPPRYGAVLFLYTAELCQAQDQLGYCAEAVMKQNLH